VSLGMNLPNRPASTHVRSKRIGCRTRRRTIGHFLHLRVRRSTVWCLVIKRKVRLLLDMVRNAYQYGVMHQDLRKRQCEG
jgi:hypothetical protein